MYDKKAQKRLFDVSKAYLHSPATPLDIEELRDVIRYHEWRYSTLNEPVLGDTEYDQLFDQLKSLEADHAQLITPDSPTQRVTSDLTSDFPSVPHVVPMLSLDNSYNADDLRKFDKTIRKLAGLEDDAQIKYCLEPKYDGGSVAITYENDVLTRAATRGNGVMGEDITLNIKTLPSVPLKALFSNYNIHKAELRGEAVIRKDRFEKLNKKREQKGLSLLANPRNSAAGGLRMKNPVETRDRQIEVFLYQLGFAESAEGADRLAQIDTHEEQILILQQLGFKIEDPAELLCQDIEEVIRKVKKWEEKREDYPYEIDGMVIKVDSRAIQEQCGYTQHHPKWAIAYKFKAKQAVTTLEHVEYQIGKIGSITPVAKVEPVHIAGVTVSSISLHNEEFIKSKDLRIGDKVVIERAGDVIPYIVKAVEDMRDGNEEPIQFPTTCPSCQSTLIQEEGEAAWRCVNFDCEAQQLQKMIFHVSKDAMDIDGFGKSYVERFSQEGWVKNISDLYHLDYEKISSLEGFGKKSAAKLETSVNKAKGNPISRLLHSLSIHHLGKKASKVIAAEIDSVFDLQKWTEERYLEIKDIGPVVAKNVSEWFAVESNIEMLRKMQSYGVNMQQTEEDKPLVVAEDAIFSGKTILFTGSLQQMTRKEAQEKAALAGAKNISAVSKNLDILVVGEKAGSKLKKAEALGTVDIMTEQEFLEKVEA